MKVLIISMFYPSMNVIASRRSEAYTKYLNLFGVHPTIVTNIWEKVPIPDSNRYLWKEHSKEQDIIIENNTHYSVIRLPRYISKKQRLIDLLLKIPLAKSFVRYGLYYLGYFEPDLIYSYDAYKKFLYTHLQTNSYDLVLTIFSPHFHIRLGYDINKKFGIPFIGDYRDLWDNRLMNDELIKKYSEKFKNWQAKKWHRKWLNYSKMHSIVSGPWLEKLNYLTKREGGIVVTNGYENEIFETNHTTISDKYFYLTHTGRIYQEHDYSYLFKTLNLFLGKLSSEQRKKVLIRFYAPVRADNYKDIRDNIPTENLLIHGWISKEEVVKRLKESAIVFFPGWSKIKGWYPGKLFEYLGSQRNVLITPTDSSVEEEIINYCKAGICSSEIDVVATFLFEKFLEWEKHGSCKYEGIPERIYEYTRESQIKKMVNTMRNILDLKSPITSSNVKR